MAGKQSQQKLFTKHLFRSGCTCPTKLYYNANASTYPERRDQLPFIAHIRYNKRQLRRLLQRLHPDGVHVEYRKYDQAVEQTKELLLREQVVLFNASFRSEAFFARVPLLIKNGNTVHIYYLQTKGFNPDRHSLTGHSGSIHKKWRDYIRDFSFQLYVIQRCYPEWEFKPYLVLPDKTAKAKADRLDRRLASDESIDRDKIEGLLAFIPVMEQVEQFWSGREPVMEDEIEFLDTEQLSFEETIDKLKEWYLSEEKVFTGVGKKCSNCEFRVDPKNLQDHQKSGFVECWDDILDGRNGQAHIFDLIGAGNGQLLKDRVFLQQEVPLDSALSPDEIADSKGRITDRHRRVLQVTRAKGQAVPHEIIKPQLLDEIRGWRYPLHFLDFEAGSYAVPLRAGRKPYQMVVFQYSCHTLHVDGNLSHHQWLHPGSGTYPNFELVNELQGISGLSEGTIIHYSGFERAALKRIRLELEAEENAKDQNVQLLEWLNTFFDSRRPTMVDLSRLVKNYYYNREMEDSLSIKDVLVATMNVSPVLKKRFSRPYNSSNFQDQIWWQKKNGSVINPYHLLSQDSDHSIGRGTEAMVAYSKLRSGTGDEEKSHKLRQNLLRYCELDTLAMVMIYLHWDEIRGQRS